MKYVSYFLLDMELLNLNFDKKKCINIIYASNFLTDFLILISAVPCMLNPCKDGSTCVNHEGGYYCQCKPNHFGKDCVKCKKK